jgi:diguanylate cyclase (GGDEF)-like protein/PAS domain S-box-containing protein
MELCAIGGLVAVGQSWMEQAYQTLVEHSLQGVVVIQDRRIVFANSVIAEMTGYTIEELLSLSPAAINAMIYPDDQAGVWEGYQRRMSGSLEPSRYALRIWHRDGSIRWMELFVTAITYNGNLAHQIAFLDNTEQKRAEEALRESEETFRNFFEQSQDSLALANSHGSIVEWNRGSEQIFGLQRWEVINYPVWDVIFKFLPASQQTAARYEEIKAHVLSYFQIDTSGTPVAATSWVERQIQDRRGKIRNVSSIVFPISTARGLMVGSITRDITDLKQAESTLQQLNAQLNNWVSDLRQRTHEMALLNDLGNFLQSCTDTDEAYNLFAQVAEHLFQNQPGALYILEPDGHQLNIAATWGNLALWPTCQQTQNCEALRRGRPYIVEQQQRGLQCLVTSNIIFQAYVCVPLVAHGETLGILRLVEPAGMSATMRKRWEQLTIAVSDHLALALVTMRLNTQLQEQAIRDPLTDLFNRRYLYETLEREISRARRYKYAIGVIMLDVDHFKQFNDTYGHPTGDKLLRLLGTFLQAHIRGDDIACRYGGEEFTLVFPQASLHDTHTRAEQLRVGARHLRIEHEDRLPTTITISLGISCFPIHGTTPDSLIEAADRALYQAKLAGRNQVQVAPTQPD